MSVWPFFLDKKGHTLIHSRASSNFFLMFLALFHQKHGACRPNGDTLTSKTSGRSQKLFPKNCFQNRFCLVFYGQKHIHSYTNFISQIGFPIFQNQFRIEVCVWVYVCILAVKNGKNTYTHTLTENTHIHSYTKLVDQTFSGDFWHKVSVSKNCFIFRFLVYVWVYVFLVYECMCVCVCVCVCVCPGGVPLPPSKTRFLTPLQNTRWK